MLSKLLKYDFKVLSKILFPIYLVCFLLTLLTRGVNLLANKFSIFSIPNGFISGLFVITLIAIPIATFIFTIIKFYQGLVKDEGYLMHTLPVSKGALVASKTISAMVFLLLSAGISIGLLFLGVYGIWFDSSFLNLVAELFKFLDTTFVVLTIITLIFSVIFQQLMFYASIALGQKHNNKVMFSIIYGIVLYNVTQILSLVILLPFMLLDPNYQQLIDSNTPNISLLNPYMIASLVLTIIIAGIYYWLTVRTLDKKLNLE